MESAKGLPVAVLMNTTIRDSGRKDTTEIKAEGLLFQKGASVFLRFQEPDEEAGKTVQTIKIKNEEMSVIRKGAVTMNQRFIQGAETEGMYHSPYGPMEMITKTKEVYYNWNSTSKTGKLRLRYNLRLQGGNAGDYDMRVTIREVSEHS
ncbi:DUF1934 domain-containing protein [Evansella clarkii]|uniref:DUF1934 domain-containing protein n=1 Tax=Evansella clarkii TaxID=79879 RepID=UPI000B42F59F|nr:DUF1934 domain-containing protein [Evansella clarkii]